MIQLKEMIHKAKLLSGSKHKEEFIDTVETVRPFVFLSDPDNPNKGEVIAHRDIEDIDLPFEICSFEDENWRKRLIMKGVGRNGEDMSIAVSCVIIKEVAPKDYKIWVYDGYDEQILMLDKNSGIGYDNVLNFVQERFINRLSTDDVGTSKTKERIKYKKDGKKHNRVIRKVVYVSKGLIKESVHGQSVNWDYSHRWEVRGHWRVVKGVGKNRSGDYCINGYTWVSAHEKGPEEMPLVKKTRVG